MPHTVASGASRSATNERSYKSELYTNSLQSFKLNSPLSRTEKHWNTDYENTAVELIQMSSVILTHH